MEPPKRRIHKMISITSLIVVGLFLIYYFLVLILERKMLSDPKDIIGKFLAISLFYAGISIIYYSLTGKPLFGDSEQAYSVYIFIIGFVAIIWTIPELLSEFKFFKKFMKNKK